MTPTGCTGRPADGVRHGQRRRWTRPFGSFVGRRAAVGQGRRIGSMTRMRTVDAAVKILEIEGATQAFGLPGAAINPFYSAMRAHGGIKHVLARHVEAASHMAEGFTSAAAGNIGVCIGIRPGRRDRHDHRVVLRLGGFHSDPGDHRSGAGGQAPQGGLSGRRHRCDRRARHEDGDDGARTRTGPRCFRAGIPPDAVGAAGPTSSICPSMSSWLRSISILSPISRCRSTNLRHRGPRPQRPSTCWCPPSGR